MAVKEIIRQKEIDICPDRSAMTARLAELGLDYAEVRTIVPGLVQFNLTDPNGLGVELTFGGAS